MQAKRTVTGFTESVVEKAALDWLAAIGWQVEHGPVIAPDALLAERANYGEVLLSRRLQDALVRLNPDLPPEALEDAFRRFTRPEAADLVAATGQPTACWSMECRWNTGTPRALFEAALPG